MHALLVGGPCHGKLLTLEDQMPSLKQRAGNAEVEYTRRSAGNQVVLYTVGDPTYSQVVDAIRKSDLLSSTGRMQTLKPGGPMPANDAL